MTESHSIIKERPSSDLFVSGVKPKLDQLYYEVNKKKLSSSQILVIDNNFFEIQVFKSGKNPTFESAYLIDDIIRFFPQSSGKIVSIDFKECFKLPSISFEFKSKEEAESFLKNLKLMKICLTSEARDSLGSNGIPLSKKIKRYPWLSQSESVFVFFLFILNSFFVFIK